MSPPPLSANLGFAEVRGKRWWVLNLDQSENLWKKIFYDVYSAWYGEMLSIIILRFKLNSKKYGLMKFDSMK